MNNLFFLFIFVPLLAFILLALNVFFAPHKPDESKVSAYECGFIPVSGQTRSIFQINFYPIAMLFLLFDLELIIIFPLGVCLYQISIYGFTMALLFFIVLTIGFILEIGSGAISFTKFIVTKENKHIIQNKRNLPNRKYLPKSLIRLLNAIIWRPVKQQLKLFYKSRTLLSGFLIKNKFLILILLIFTLISLIFHKNIVYFKDINIYDNYSVLIIISVVLIYFTYIKFNLMIRIIYLVKSIPFFYKMIKQKKITDIKVIALYYYFFNILIIIFSIIFVIKINYNLSYLNISYFLVYTNIISILFVLFVFEQIFTTEFNIVENNNFKPLMVLCYIIILFIPVIVFNCYYEKIMAFLGESVINKFVIHCETTGDTNFRDKLIDKNSLVIGPRRYTSHNSNINIITPESQIASTSSLVKNEENSNNSNFPAIKLEQIFELEEISKKTLNKFIVEYYESPYIEFDDAYYTRANKKKNILYEIDTNLLKSINFYADVFHVHNLPKKHFIDFIFNLDIFDMDYKAKHLAINSDFVIKKSELEILRQKQEAAITKALDEYNHFRDHEYPEKYAEIKSNFETKSKDLESARETNVYKEINRFKKAAKKMKIILNKISSNNSSSDEEELFYTSKKTNNSTTTIDSVDSDETIKPSRRDE